MPQGKGTYGSNVGRPKKRKVKPGSANKIKVGLRRYGGQPRSIMRDKIKPDAPAPPATMPTKPSKPGKRRVKPGSANKIKVGLRRYGGQPRSIMRDKIKPEMGKEAKNKYKQGK